MMLISLALYGSWARQDNDPTSDLDLLGVTTDATRTTLSYDNVRMLLYPRELIVRHAKRGDLFVLHLASEAKVLYDPNSVFPEIADAFSYKKTYESEIKLASDCGWFLADYRRGFGDGRLFNKSVDWCARTILMARAADRRLPVFSAQGLADFSGSSDILDITGNKNSSRIEPDVVEKLENLLRTYGVNRPSGVPTLKEHRSLFKAENNRVGLAAVRSLVKEIEIGHK